MNCKKCGAELKPDSYFCPVCGARTDDNSTNASAETSTVQNITIFDEKVESQESNNTSNEEPITKQQNSASLSKESKRTVMPKTPKKLTKGKRALLISGVAVLLIGILAVTAYFLGCFKSPDEILQETLNEQIDTTISDEIADSLDRLKTASQIPTDTSTGRTKLVLNDEAKELILNILKKELDSNTVNLLGWINTLDCESAVTYDGNLISCELFIHANDHDITKLDMVIDESTQKAYITLPEVNPTAISMDFSESDISELKSYLGFFTNRTNIFSTISTMAELIPMEYLSIDLDGILPENTDINLANIIPEKSTTKAIVAKYLKLLVAGVSDVEQSGGFINCSGPVEADRFECNGISADSDCYMFKLSSNALTSNIKNILTALKTDEDVRKIIIAYENESGISGYADNFYEEIDNTLKNLSEDDIKESIGDYLAFKIWLGDDDAFLGVSICDSKNDFGFKYTSILKDNKYASSINYTKEENEIITISTNGTISNGKFNGSTKFAILKDTITLTLGYSDFDVEQYKNHLTNGTYTIEKLPDIISLVPQLRSFANTKFTLNIVQKSQNEQYLKLTAEKNGELFCSFEQDLGIAEKKEVKIPDDTTDTGSMFGWIRRANLSDLMNKLEQAGFSYDVLDLLQMLFF